MLDLVVWHSKMRWVRRYRVMVDDNFHYADESERIEHGRYRTEAKAIATCQRIVDESLRHLYEPGMRSEELLKQYLFFGDDPFVQVPQGTPVVRFSARDYARERVAAICGSDTK